MSALGTWRFRLARSLGRFVTTTCAVLTLGRMPPFVSASAIVRDRDRILAIVDPILGEPVIPGGHLKWRETPAGAVAREVYEETGYHIQVGHLIRVAATEELTGEPGIVRIIYWGAVVGGTLRSSHEGPAVWLPIEEFAARSSRDGPIVREWLAQSATGGYGACSAPSDR